MRKTYYSPIDFEYIVSSIAKSDDFIDEMFYKKILIKKEDFNTLFILDEA